LGETGLAGVRRQVGTCIETRAEAGE